jgi:hypothetical protein
MPQKEIPWSFSMTATATGGLCELSRTAVSVSQILGTLRNLIELTGELGYLPAEHIETPTERLARLNKHRNIDLAQTMLGDTPDKGKSSLKTAMRRRKKTVTFTAPTYVEASDVDYSSDEEDELEGDAAAQDQATQQQSQAQQAVSDEIAEDESAKVEPLKPRSQKQAGGETAGIDDNAAEDEAAEGRASEEIFDNRNEARVRTTKNGTVRNTDSFFKDETIETKKISLTPALFRDDEAREGEGEEGQGQEAQWDSGLVLSQ